MSARQSERARVIGCVCVCERESHREREIGNLLPNNQRQRRTCYALCHILYPVSAALASFFRMDSNSTSFTFSFDLRNRAHSLPPRPVDSTAYLTPPSRLPWLERTHYIAPYIAPRTSRTPQGPSLQTEHKALSACDTVSPQAKTYSHYSAAVPPAALPTSRGNPRGPTLMVLYFILVRFL